MLQSPGVLVHGAVVVSLLHVVQILLGLVLLSSGVRWGSRRDGSDEHDWEWSEEDLRLGLVEAAISLVPTGTLEEETVDQAAISWDIVESPVLNAAILSGHELSLRIGPVLDFIERPLELLLLPCDLLLHGSEETLGIEETG